MIPTLKEKIKQNILDADMKLKKEEVKEVSSSDVSTHIKNDTLLSGTKISNSLTKEEKAPLQSQENQQENNLDEFSENIKNTFQQFVERIVNAIIKFLRKINPFLRDKAVQKARTKKELKDLEKKLSKK